MAGNALLTFAWHGWGIVGASSGATPAHPNTATEAQDGLIASEEPGWPQWRGPCRDGISQEVGLLPEWPEGGPPLLWKRQGIGTGWSSPIVVGEMVYLTGDVDEQLVVWAFSRDGKLRWKTTNGKAWTGSYPGAEPRVLTRQAISIT